jgi:organic hydroperoxide reductase OsmC/OhrA
MNERAHTYDVRVTWEGEATTSYAGYDRAYRVEIDGKPVLRGSADPAFRGDASLHNPEDLFVTALSTCHMLTYLALAAKHRIAVLRYEDRATGTLALTREGGGRFESVVLRPVVTVADAAHLERARALHEDAQKLCFIAASVAIPLRHEAEVRA